MTLLLLQRTRGDDCLSDLVLDQLRVRELDARAATRARSHLVTCARCSERLRALEDDASASASELPPLPAAPRRAPPWRIVAGFTAAAAALLLVVVGRPGAVQVGVETPSEHEDRDAPTTRTKGAPTLQFYIRRGDAVLEGGPGERLYPGDHVRFAYSWTEPGYITVLSRDGAGELSVYFPSDAGAYAAQPGERVDLPGAVQLDEVTGPEVFYGVFCAREVSPERLRQALLAERDASTIHGCELDRVRVDKRAAR